MKKNKFMIGQKVDYIDQAKKQQRGSKITKQVYTANGYYVYQLENDKKYIKESELENYKENNRRQRTTTEKCLVAIVNNGKIRISKYLTVFGSPSETGIELLDFCQNNNLTLLKDKTAKLEICSDDEYRESIRKLHELRRKSKDSLSNEEEEEYKQLKKINNERTSAMFLNNILSLEGNTITAKNDIKYAYDSLRCDWGYLINFDNNKLEVYKGKNFECLTEKDRFYGDKQENGFYGIKLVNSFDLSNLPSYQDFINQIKG